MPTLWGGFIMMELGNMIFGNSRGAFSIDRDLWQKLFEPLWDKLDHHRPFENNTFIIFPYYWGDCTCGHDELEIEWDENNKHGPACYQRDYRKLVDNHKHNVPDHLVEQLCAKHGIDYNDGWGSAIHCTCDHQKKWIEFCENHSHDEECPLVKPNFVFKPTGLEVQWYKYPFRDSYSNMRISKEEIAEVVLVCLNSLTDMPKLASCFEKDLEKLKDKLQDYDFAVELYCALCNTYWYPISLDTERFPIKYDNRYAYGITWRSAGGLVADLRGLGEDYLHFYCSGMIHDGAPGEGRVSNRVEAELNNLGWTYQPMG